jgi:hypothetical protein
MSERLSEEEFIRQTVHILRGQGVDVRRSDAGRVYDWLAARLADQDARLAAAVEADRRAAAAKIREYAAGYFSDTQAEGFEVAARIAEGWLRRPATTAGLKELSESLAVAMSGVGTHRDPCRIPDTPCLCGLVDFRTEAAALVRAALHPQDPDHERTSR